MHAYNRFASTLSSKNIWSSKYLIARFLTKVKWQTKHVLNNYRCHFTFICNFPCDFEKPSVCCSSWSPSVKIEVVEIGLNVFQRSEKAASPSQRHVWCLAISRSDCRWRSSVNKDFPTLRLTSEHTRLAYPGVEVSQERPAKRACCLHGQRSGESDGNAVYVLLDTLVVMTLLRLNVHDYRQGLLRTEHSFR